MHEKKIDASQNYTELRERDKRKQLVLTVIAAETHQLITLDMLIKFCKPNYIFFVLTSFI